MPRWDEIVWTNDKARVTWEPRMRRIAAAWAELERASVAEGVREACVQSALPLGLAALSEWAAGQGLVALPLGPDTCPIVDRPARIPAGKRWNDRVVITRPELAVGWLRAWQAGDDEAIGRRLGIPACCVAFGRRVRALGADTSWSMAEGARELEPTTRRVDLSAPECNVLLRRLGVRLVPHLPCSFLCRPTIRLGRALAQVAVRYGHARELEWAREMLSWPVVWSAAGGVGEIETPAFRVSVPAGTAPVRHTVRLGSTRPPAGRLRLRLRRPAPARPA